MINNELNLNILLLIIFKYNIYRRRRCAPSLTDYLGHCLNKKKKDHNTKTKRNNNKFSTKKRRKNKQNI